VPDRVVRDELLDSDRFLWLPSDTDRLCYIGLLLRCDDFGNLEGGPRRLFRFFAGFAQTKSEESAGATITHLADADLIRRYEVSAREFFHIPRFRPHRQYLVRKCPPSPWCDLSVVEGKRRVINRGLAQNLVATSPPDSRHIAEGVEVGVEVGVGEKRTSAAVAVDKSAKKEPTTWAEHWKAKGKALGINAKAGETEGDYCRRVMVFAKDRAKA
jgi:hypothetical protein